MAEIKAVPLGAGQDVGRSCILISMGGKNVMLDCGMHMGFQDERRFPDFSYICAEGPLDAHIDAVIVSHFHLDHCGALPHMTEMVGYNGPIFMTHPTKAICPILLEDMRKIAVEKKGETNFFTSAMIKSCMEKVTAVNLHQTIQVSENFEIRAYYAGHVLGAAMFWIRVGQQSVVYTGDYNMTPDRHLGAAWIDRCRPDLLITESTYATTIRDSKRCRERDFLKKVHDCIDHGGKVLIPVFALGRAQELCILLETYWDRMNLKVPIYFTVGMTEKANHYYKLFITWTNQKIKKTFVDRNLFDFKHIKTFEKSYLDLPGPAVIFATPGMLHAGQSLQIFRKLAPSDKNLLVMPGYCVHGTVGAKVIAGQKKIEMPGDKQIVHVKLQVQYMSFSAHADAKGICQLLGQCQPKNVMLVHGEAIKMQFLKTKLKQEFGLDCYMPANGETISIQTPPRIPVDVSVALLKKQAALNTQKPEAGPLLKRPFSGALVIQDNKMRLVDAEQTLRELDVPLFHVRFTSSFSWPDSSTQLSELTAKLHTFVLQVVDGQVPVTLSVDEYVITVSDNVLVSVEDGNSAPQVLVSWALQDEEIGGFLVQALRDEFSDVKPDVKQESEASRTSV